MRSRRSFPYVALGLAYMLGLLATDLIFDAVSGRHAGDAGFLYYYCVLLPALFNFPDNLRYRITASFPSLPRTVFFFYEP